MPAIVPLTDPVFITCVLLFTTLIAPWIAARLRIPPLVVLILSGTLLGSHGLGLLVRDDRLILLEKIGLLYIMLLAGIQIDLRNLKRLGSRALIFGLLTFSIPFTVGILCGHWLGYGLLTMLLLGILYSPHTLVSYPIMIRLGITQHEAVGVAVGGTVLTSLLTLVGLSIEQAIASHQVDVWLAIKLFILLPLLILLSFWSMPKLGQVILKNPLTSHATQLLFVLTCLFIAASGTVLLGIDAIVGAFIAGLALNSLLSSNMALIGHIELVGSSFFIPAFLISVGVLCNPGILITHPENLGLASTVILGAVGAKFLAAWIASVLFRYSLAEMMVIFSLTLSRAALVLVIALFGQRAGLISEAIFNAIILYIVVTCLTSPFIADTFGRRLISTAAEQSPAESGGV